MPRIHLEEISNRGKLGMSLAVDGAGFVADKSLADFQSGLELRRARLYFEGEWLLLTPIAYTFEIAYVPSEFFMEDSYIAVRELRGIGELKIGQYTTPMGLDQATGSRDRTFMEPAAPIQALTPGANAGLQMGRSILDQRLTWRFGVFGNGVGSEFGDASQDAARAIGRLTWLPWFQQDPDRPWSRRLLHLGLSSDFVYSGNGILHYRSRPESHLAPFVIDTGEISADKAETIGLEAAWVSGPLSVQGEYLHSFVQDQAGEGLQFQGFYAGASWFLTGESRAYNRSEGKFARVTPRRPFSFDRRGGLGAWEIGGRFSYTDLQDGRIHGGRLTAVTGGLTWYPHSHVRWKFNYVFGNVKGRTEDGPMHIFETRAEFDF